MLTDEGKESDEAITACGSMWEKAQEGKAIHICDGCLKSLSYQPEEYTVPNLPLPCAFCGDTPKEGTALVQMRPAKLPAKSLDDAMIIFGGEVKALGDGKVGGYLVRFTDETEPDIVGDFFDATTKFGDAAASPVYYNHGLDRTLGLRALGEGKLETQDVGIWIEAQLGLRDEYERAVYALAEKGKLGWSSGTAPHLVQREEKGQAWHVKKWPLGLDASLTPTPADPSNRALPLKSWAEMMDADSLKAVMPEEGSGEESSATATAGGVTVNVHVHKEGKAVEAWKGQQQR
jgi:phage head maturation protease